MRLISIAEGEDFEEIVLEETFLFFFKSVSVYRKYGNSIFEYTAPDKYRALVVSEYCTIRPYFNIR